MPQIYSGHFDIKEKPGGMIMCACALIPPSRVWSKADRYTSSDLDRVIAAPKGTVTNIQVDITDLARCLQSPRGSEGLVSDMPPMDDRPDTDIMANIPADARVIGEEDLGTVTQRDVVGQV